MNFTRLILTRKGALEMTLFKPYSTADDATFLGQVRELLKGVSIKQGEAYADFKDGDKVARMSLAQLLTVNPAKSNLAGILGWVGCGLGVLLVLGTTVYFVKGLKRSAKRAAREVDPAPVAVVSPALTATSNNGHGSNGSNGSNGNGNGASHPAVAAQVEKAGQFRTAGEFKAKGKSTPIVGSQQRSALPKKLNGSQKLKREFDYNRYFADLMSTVSSSTLAERQAANGIMLDRAQLGNAPEANGSAHPAERFTANTDIIAHQNALIEEQRRLIQEQTKLIEEKSRLIAEKNSLLKLQAELIEHKML
jgi:hypothetical protein